MKHLWICLQISKKSVHHEAFVSIFQISNIPCNMTQLWTFPDLKTNQCILAFVQMFRISREVVASWQIVNSFQISRRIQYAFPAPTYPGTPVLISLALATTFPNETPPSNLPARDQHTKKNLKRHMASFFLPLKFTHPKFAQLKFVHLEFTEQSLPIWNLRRVIRASEPEAPSLNCLVAHSWTPQNPRSQILNAGTHNQWAHHMSEDFADTKRKWVNDDALANFFQSPKRATAAWRICGHFPDSQKASVHHAVLVTCFRSPKKISASQIKSLHHDTGVIIFQISKENQCNMAH